MRRLFNTVLARILVREERGQMAVEFAVLMPVIIVVALIVFNVLRYAELCARFDRVAPDAVLTQGVSPEGSTGALASVDAVSTQLQGAMGNNVEVSVSAENLGLSSGAALVNLAAGTTRFTCTFVFYPWPSSASIAGASFSAPAITHTKELVVDCYRAAIIT